MNPMLSEILLNLLIDEGIEQIIYTTSTYLGYPVMLVDVGYNLISHYPEEKLDDPLWDTIHEYGSASPEFVSKLHAQKMMRLGESSIEPYYIDWGFLKNSPRIIMNLRLKYKHYGFLAVVCDNSTPEMLATVKLIGKVCMMALQKEDVGALASTDYQSMFLRYLFDENGISKEQLRSWEYNLSFVISEPYYVACCSFKSKKDLIRTQSFIQMVIKKIHTRVLCHVYNNKEMVFLLTSMKEQGQVITFVNMIKEALPDYKLCFGVSNPFCELEKAFIYLEQAQHALKIANVKRVMYMNYKDCMLEQFLSVIYQGLPRESSIHYSVSRIIEYDKEKGTEYLKTLEVYVKSWFSLKKTVELLHIHRNTLPHRLKIIEKIGDINLDNPETRTVLLLNFYMNLE